jgi:hypothetical protein
VSRRVKTDRPSRKVPAVRYRTYRTWAAIVICVMATLCTAMAASSEAATSATISPTLAPDRLGGEAALTVAVNFTTGGFGVPAPLRQSVLWLPAGLSLNLPILRSCSAARLQALGARGCPRESKIGEGHARLEAYVGSLMIGEDASMSLFLGAPRNLTPTFELLGQGYTPIDERIVSTGTVIYTNAPYGEELMMPIPAIPTLALEPDASIVALSLTVGARTASHRRRGSAIVVASSCPQGGFPFAGEFSYTDGSSSNATAAIPCPQQTTTKRG